MISSELCPVLVQRHGLMARAPLEKATRGWSLSGLAARFLRYTRVWGNNRTCTFATFKWWSRCSTNNTAWPSPFFFSDGAGPNWTIRKTTGASLSSPTAYFQTTGNRSNELVLACDWMVIMKKLMSEAAWRWREVSSLSPPFWVCCQNSATKWSLRFSVRSDLLLLERCRQLWPYCQFAMKHVYQRTVPVICYIDLFDEWSYQ